jgi:hypothetical protein
VRHDSSVSKVTSCKLDRAQFHERQEFFSCHFVQDCLWHPYSITNFSWTIYHRPLPSHHLYVSMAWCSGLQAILPVTLYMLHSHRYHNNLKQQISRSAVCSPGLKLISELLQFLSKEESCKILLCYPPTVCDLCTLNIYIYTYIT